MPEIRAGLAAMHMGAIINRNACREYERERVSPSQKATIVQNKPSPLRQSATQAAQQNMTS
jgi:hypothetical protein